MPSQASRSSLLGPPVTVYEGEEDEEDLKMPPRTAPKAATNDDNLPMLSPPVERAIHDFNEELDAVTESLDVLMTQLKEKKNQRQLPPPSYPSTVRKPKYQSSPSRDQDPPPSLSFTPAYDSTPARMRGGTTGSLASYTTPLEPPPPAPVETPYRFNLLPTPAAKRTPSRRAKPRVSPPSPPPEMRGNFVERDYQGTRKSGDRFVEELLNIVREQRAKIQDLEIENEVMKAKLKSGPATIRIEREPRIRFDDDFREPTAGPHPQRVEEAPPPTHHRSEDPDGRLHQRRDQSPYHPPAPAMTPGRSQSSYMSTPSRMPAYVPRQQPPPQHYQQPLSRQEPPRHIHTLDEAIDQTGGQFSEGTKFVSQLAGLMDIEKGHAAPLSYILDRHWDRLRGQQ